MTHSPGIIDSDTFMLSIGGLRIAARTTGSGDPVLLLNGMSRPMESWAPIASANSGIRLVSDRLVLREFVLTDEDAVHAFAADPLVTQFTDWGPNSIEDTRAFLAEATTQATNPQRAEFTLAAVPAGEITGIGGAETAAVEGRIAGLAATGERHRITGRLARRKRAAAHFTGRLAAAHPLRTGWHDWLDEDTPICRCEGTVLSQLRAEHSETHYGPPNSTHAPDSVRAKAGSAAPTSRASAAPTTTTLPTLQDSRAHETTTDPSPNRCASVRSPPRATLSASTRANDALRGRQRWRLARATGGRQVSVAPRAPPSPVG